jgi:iron complex transport system ATP-binding protein
MIRFDGVTVRYPRSDRDALSSLSLELERARLTAVVGPNGSGKSTLLRTLLRRVPRVGGRIDVDGAPLESLNERGMARRVAFVAQREDLVFPMGVRDYIALGRFPHVGMLRALDAADRQAIDAAIARAEVEPFLERRIDALSGGEWQRVRLARALAQSADALALDEPTAFLDIAHEMAVFELLVKLAADGQAILLVSHQLNLVARFATRIVLLDQGHIAASGSPDDVMQVDILERVYQWPLTVTRDPVVGAPALIPLRTRR